MPTGPLVSQLANLGSRNRSDRDQRDRALVRVDRRDRMVANSIVSSATSGGAKQSSAATLR
jgi:hypothetical protein